MHASVDVICGATYFREKEAVSSLGGEGGGGDGGGGEGGSDGGGGEGGGGDGGGDGGGGEGGGGLAEAAAMAVVAREAAARAAAARAAVVAGAGAAARVAALGRRRQPLQELLAAPGESGMQRRRHLQPAWSSRPQRPSVLAGSGVGAPLRQPQR